LYFRYSHSISQIFHFYWSSYIFKTKIYKRFYKYKSKEPYICIKHSYRFYFSYSCISYLKRHKGACSISCFNPCSLCCYNRTIRRCRVCNMSSCNPPLHSVLVGILNSKPCSSCSSCYRYCHYLYSGSICVSS